MPIASGATPMRPSSSTGRRAAPRTDRTIRENESNRNLVETHSRGSFGPSVGPAVAGPPVELRPVRLRGFVTPCFSSCQQLQVDRCSHRSGRFCSTSTQAVQRNKSRDSIATAMAGACFRHALGNLIRTRASPSTTSSSGCSLTPRVPRWTEMVFPPRMIPVPCSLPSSCSRKRPVGGS